MTWSDWVPVILFVALGLTILVLFEVRARKEGKPKPSSDSPLKEGEIAGEEARGQALKGEDGECCGQHLVCERETLLQTNAQVVYYDDEELDALAGTEPADYTPEQYGKIREVFDTLQPSDVPGWVRSIQLRGITLPPDIREEALLIVIDRRHSPKTI